MNNYNLENVTLHDYLFTDYMTSYFIFELYIADVEELEKYMNKNYAIDVIRLKNGIDEVVIRNKFDRQEQYVFVDGVIADGNEEYRKELLKTISEKLLYKN